MCFRERDSKKCAECFVKRLQEAHETNRLEVLLILVDLESA